jgi:hypothetical protein
MPNEFATKVAQSCQSMPPFAAIPWMTLLDIAVQVGLYLVQCYQKNHSSTPPQQTVSEQYVDGQYNQRFLGNMIRRVHRAASVKGQRLTPEQARELAVQALDAIRLGSDDDIQGALTSAN